MRSATGLHIRSFGEGGRPILAVHCTLSHGGAWRGLAATLGHDVMLAAPDLPGHGHSDDWDGKTDYHDACTGAIRPLLDRPLDVLGHSFGATIALRLALERPDRIRSLCLIEPVLFAAARLDDPVAFAQFENDAVPHEQALARGEFDLAARLFNRIWGDGRPWDKLAERTHRYITHRMPLVPAQNNALVHDSAGLLSEGRLQQLNAPVLLVRGDLSPAVTAVVNRALADRLPYANEAVVRGAGHLAPVTHPKAVTDALRPLLKMT